MWFTNVIMVDDMTKKATKHLYLIYLMILLNSFKKVVTNSLYMSTL